jgi:hypothetical protein
MICPKCKENSARRAERKGFFDKVANQFMLKPYVCAACRYRFHALSGKAAGPGVWQAIMERVSRLFSRNQGERARRELTMYILAGVVISVLVYVFTRPPA